MCCFDGMEEGLFPHTNSMLELEDLEEERRLCYVAITRAMEKIFMTHTNTRLYFGNIQANMPSRFLNEIPEKLLEHLGTSRAYGRGGLGSGHRGAYGRTGYENFSGQEVNEFFGRHGI